jgi:hypothetical protein
LAQISGGDAGWGWNAEAAKRNAANYQWNGDEMLFQIGSWMYVFHHSIFQMDILIGKCGCGFVLLSLLVSLELK